MMKLKPLLCLGVLTAAASLLGQTTSPPDANPVSDGKDRRLYVVGYSHLDTQWRWTYPQVIQEFVANTMRQNFALFDRYPGYIFNFTGARRYEFMKEYYPEDFARVKKYVAEGRWFPAGSSMDEDDAIMPSLESFQRHFLYGNRFFDREFGLHSQEFMLPDSFGFPAALPTILHHGGIKGFSTQKLPWGSAVGIPFSVGVWVGPDGSEVLAALNPLSYTSRVTGDLSKSNTWLDRINVIGNQSGAYVDYHYVGVGDRGGAPEEKSVQWVEQSLTSDGPVKVLWSHSDQMFKEITPGQAAKLPHYQGELLLTEHSAGSLTSEAYMKRWNRKNELLANAAETAATAASWLGAFPYPHEALNQAWDLVLGSQMHDMLAGTCVPKAYEYSWNDELLALNCFAAVTEDSSSAVLSLLDTSAQGTPLAVYNPLSVEREDPVEVLLPFTGEAPAAVTAFDSVGRPVPTQVLGCDGHALRVIFVAKAPSLGYAIYDLRTGIDASPKTGLSVTNKTLESPRYRVTLDADGDAASIFDKAAKRELLAAPARLAFQSEHPHKYPAWNMDWADRQQPPRAFVGGPARVRVVENGPVRVALEVERTTEGSTFTEQIRLAAGSAGDRVEYLTHINWRSSGASLKTDYRLTVANPSASYDAQVGVVRRDNNNPQRYEAPLHQWMDLTDASGVYGVAVLNDSKFGSDKPADNALRLTLLYTPGVRDEFQDQASQDEGRHEILYALAGHTGDWAQAGVPWQAARLNQPLRAFLPTAHPGPLGRAFSFAALNNSQASVVALKKAEDSDEIIVRVKELTGQAAPGLKLSFPEPVVSAREVDGQEHAINPMVPAAGTLGFDLKPFGVRAFAVRLDGPAVSVSPVVSRSVALTYDLDVVSPDSDRSDGAIDAEGRTYPAELFPASLERAGVKFQLGSSAAGAKNAVVASGQSIDLPIGGYNRVYLLAAARHADFSGKMQVGDRTVPLSVPLWRDFIGQWDRRLWDKPIPEISYDVKQKNVGLVPGYVKSAQVAWFATHHHTPQGNAFYDFSYLFEFGADLPPGTTRLALPKDENLLVFAVSVAQMPGIAPAAAPLADTLADHHIGGASEIPQAGGSYQDATLVHLVPPLYHTPDDLRYTLDGSEPGSGSPVYSKPFFLARTATIKVRQVMADGLGPVATGTLDVRDTTPPKLLTATGGTRLDEIKLVFSEPLDRASASRVDTYMVTPSMPVRAATLADDGCTVLLTLADALVPDTKYVVEMPRIMDLAGNRLVNGRFEMSPFGVVYRRSSVKLPSEKFETKVENLPLNASDGWTVSLLVKPDAVPEERTLIGGFGRPTDNADGGTGRYFAVFKDGIRFWVAREDVKTHSPLEVGRWQMLAATYDGKTITVYKDGHPIGKREVELSDDSDHTVSAGLPDAWRLGHLFEGQVQAFEVRRGMLTPEQVKKLAADSKPL